MKDIIAYDRIFLGGPRSLRCASWELYKTEASGDKICGAFRLAWRDKIVTIHSLDLEPDSSKDYFNKLDVLRSQLHLFVRFLQDDSSTIRADRGWLNNLETGATGSFAYCVRKDTVEMTYFELASCDEKVRIYKQDFDNDDEMLSTMFALLQFLSWMIGKFRILAPWGAE